MFIIRVDFGSRVRYGTTPGTDTVNIRFVRKHRRTGKTIGGLFAEVEDAGPDKSRIEITWRNDRHEFINDRGLKGLYPGNMHFRLLDRHHHIRRLSPKDAEGLGFYDRQIAELEDELKRERDKRAEFVKAAWRRAEKVQLDEIEQAARANLPQQKGAIAHG